MEADDALLWLGLAVLVFALLGIPSRLRLARAKHRSLRGHAGLARFVARLMPFYEYSDEEFFRTDGAPGSVAVGRRRGLTELAGRLSGLAPRSVALGRVIEQGVSDALFTSMYRVPFQYRAVVREHLRLGGVACASSGTKVSDVDGNWAYDLTGSYGVNLFGYDFYKDCIDRGIERVRDLGPVLGQYHPVVADNVERLKRISGLDEVSFHMSGTEAVMQAVRLARFHTRRLHVVQFCGAYHGWWDGVQPDVGSRRPLKDAYVLEEMSNVTLAVLAERSDIACVLVNPVQAMHPNAGAPGDGTLVDGSRTAHFDKAAYAEWLQALRAICTRRRIPLIFDEVFVGFRLAYGGAQEYFGVRADLVTYGKTLGGGLPVGVVCGKRSLMKRFRDDKPGDICFARGTFNSHPYVMGAMNEFLRHIDDPVTRAQYRTLDTVWNARAAALNARLEAKTLPVRIVNLVSIWTIVYTQPGRYHWMFQYYLRAQGLLLSWIGSGRLIFSHNFADAEFLEVADAFVRAADQMQADGWWWCSPKATHQTIRRRILYEMLTRGLRRRRAPTRRAPKLTSEI